jgi:TatD DNase family protein
MYFDTHAHYDDEAFGGEADEVLCALSAAGVELVVNVGCDRASSERSVALAHRYPFVYAAVGTHPYDAAALSDDDMARYRALLTDPKVRAIGEIGLDYHYDSPSHDDQKRAFEAQLQLAAELKKPVIIHSRDACEDTMQIVRKYAADVTGVFHCYAYSVETAKELVNLGWYLSFTGVVTFKNARKALEVIEWAPLSRMFIETDSPYLAPEPHRGSRNDSRYVPLVAQKIAEVKGLPVEQVARATLENGKKFFGIEDLT